MRESRAEGPATHGGPESCRRGREAAPEALTGESAGRVLSREIVSVPGAEAVTCAEGSTRHSGMARSEGPGAVGDPEHARKHLAREPGDPEPALEQGGPGPRREVQGLKPPMYGPGSLTGPIVPTKPPNKGTEARARSYGRPYTGTKAETPDTAKGRPKAPSESDGATAEGVEGRGRAEGNLPSPNALRTQGREGVGSARGRIRHE